MNLLTEIGKIHNNALKQLKPCFKFMTYIPDLIPSFISFIVVSKLFNCVNPSFISL